MQKMTAHIPAKSNTRLRPASLLHREFNTLSEKMNRLSDLALEMDRTVAHYEFYPALYELNDLVYGRIIRIFDAAERFLFEHIESFLPDPSSLGIIKDEQRKLLKLCNSIQTYLSEPEEDDEKEQLQSLILTLEKRLRRHVHLIDAIFTDELMCRLPEEIAEKVYSDMSNFIKKGVHI